MATCPLGHRSHPSLCNRCPHGHPASRDSQGHCLAPPPPWQAWRPPRLPPASCKQRGAKSTLCQGSTSPINARCRIQHQPPASTSSRAWQHLHRHRVPCPPGTLHPGTGTAAAGPRWTGEPPQYPRFWRHQDPQQVGRKGQTCQDSSFASWECPRSWPRSRRHKPCAGQSSHATAQLSPALCASSPHPRAHALGAVLTRLQHRSSTRSLSSCSTLL